MRPADDLERLHAAALGRAVRFGGRVIVSVRCAICHAPAAEIHDTPEGFLYVGMRRPVPAEVAMARLQSGRPQTRVSASLATAQRPWPDQLIAGCSKKHDLAYVAAADLESAVQTYLARGRPQTIPL